MNNVIKNKVLELKDAILDKYMKDEYLSESYDMGEIKNIELSEKTLLVLFNNVYAMNYIKNQKIKYAQYIFATLDEDTNKYYISNLFNFNSGNGLYIDICFVECSENEQIAEYEYRISRTMTNFSKIRFSGSITFNTSELYIDINNVEEISTRIKSLINQIPDVNKINELGLLQDGYTEIYNSTVRNLGYTIRYGYDHNDYRYYSTDGFITIFDRKAIKCDFSDIYDNLSGYITIKTNMVDDMCIPILTNIMLDVDDITLYPNEEFVIEKNDYENNKTHIYTIPNEYIVNLVRDEKFINILLDIVDECLTTHYNTQVQLVDILKAEKAQLLRERKIISPIF